MEIFRNRPRRIFETLAKSWLSLLSTR